MSAYGLTDAIKGMVPTRAPYSGVCGESFDHDEQVIYEDAHLYQWMCRSCGAEGWSEDGN